jgi:hypothetical protein
MAIWNILRTLGTFCGNVVYFPHFGIFSQGKSGNPELDSLASSPNGSPETVELQVTGCPDVARRVGKPLKVLRTPAAVQGQVKLHRLKFKKIFFFIKKV